MLFDNFISIPRSIPKSKLRRVKSPFACNLAHFSVLIFINIISLYFAIGIAYTYQNKCASPESVETKNMCVHVRIGNEGMNGIFMFYFARFSKRGCVVIIASNSRLTGSYQDMFIRDKRQKRALTSASLEPLRCGHCCSRCVFFS